jgi:septal ring factor EnvC (AmiA/AmiB activator)
LSENDFYTPTDADALRMENELLTFEVRFLKSRLAEAERLENQLEQSKRRLDESERSVERIEARLAQAERAEQDLVLLLRRLSNSPLAPLFKRKQGFRALRERYLGADV